jgi:hypothetical protein
MTSDSDLFAPNEIILGLVAPDAFVLCGLDLRSL